eukprot:SAG31_NODE_2202_length_6200_cov_2.292083_5_plen_308_part_00
MRHPASAPPLISAAPACAETPCDDSIGDDGTCVSDVQRCVIVRNLTANGDNMGSNQHEQNTFFTSTVPTEIGALLGIDDPADVQVFRCPDQPRFSFQARCESVDQCEQISQVITQAQQASTGLFGDDEAILADPQQPWDPLVLPPPPTTGDTPTPSPTPPAPPPGCGEMCIEVEDLRFCKETGFFKFKSHLTQWLSDDLHDSGAVNEPSCDDPSSCETGQCGDCPIHIVDQINGNANTTYGTLNFVVSGGDRDVLRGYRDQLCQQLGATNRASALFSSLRRVTKYICDPASSFSIKCYGFDCGGDTC